jgi:protease IV
MCSFSDYLKYLFAKSIAILIVAVILIIGTVYLVVWQFDKFDNKSNPLSDPSCNIAVIQISGDISMFEEKDTLTAIASEIEDQIQTADETDHIRGIVIEVNSYGGNPFASEMIMNAVQRASKPTVALIQQVGTSGAYLISSAADRIIASQFSEIAGIGVTQSYVETAGSLGEEGKRFIELTAGKYKDMGNPNRLLTDEEKTLLQRDLNITHELFINHVAENRKLSVEDVKKLADGSTMMGDMALKNKLIDAIGDEKEAIEWLRMKTGKDTVACE